MTAGDTNQNLVSAAESLWDSHGITHIGRVRLHNEDAFLSRPDIGLWAVADGMGGHMAGDVASQAIVDNLQEVQEPTSLSHFVYEVETKLQMVNKKLLEMGAAYNPKSIIGSTIAILLIYDDMAALLWAGDSRVYRYRDDLLEQLTTDHSQVETYIEQGLISRDEASIHPDSNMITRAIGAEEHLNLDIEMYRLQSGDRFLLCTDGLTRYLRDSIIVRYLSGSNAAQSCSSLVDETLAHQAADNITALVVDYF